MRQQQRQRIAAFIMGMSIAALVHLFLVVAPSSLTFFSLEEAASTTDIDTDTDSGTGDYSQYLLPNQDNTNATTVPMGPNKRPIMHTFFEPVSGGCCGMSEEGHLDLLSAWEESWQAAGWDTQILTTQDAWKHPSTPQFQTLLQTLSVNEYNRKCFLRWFAMASNGGGWMSDYDTFPLHMDPSHVHVHEGEGGGIHLPHDGTLTVWEKAIPSLVSGSEPEWDRMVHLFLEVIPHHHGAGGDVTDMLVLESIRLELGTKAAIFVPPREQVWQGYLYFGEGVYCSFLRYAMAIHFSHESVAFAVKEGTFPVPVEEGGEGWSVEGAMDKRGSAARIYLGQWREQCPDDGL